MVEATNGFSAPGNQSRQTKQGKQRGDVYLADLSQIATYLSRQKLQNSIGHPNIFAVSANNQSVAILQVGGSSFQTIAFKRLEDCSTKELIASFEARLSFFEARLGFFEARLASFETRVKLLFTPFPFLGRYEYFGEEILGTKISISVVQILYFRSLCGFCTLEASARFCHLAQTDD